MECYVWMMIKGLKTSSPKFYHQTGFFQVSSFHKNGTQKNSYNQMEY